MFLPIRASFHTILCLEQDVPSTGWILCIFRIPCKKKKRIVQINTAHFSWTEITTKIAKNQLTQNFRDGDDRILLSKHLGIFIFVFLCLHFWIICTQKYVGPTCSLSSSQGLDVQSAVHTTQRDKGTKIQKKAQTEQESNLGLQVPFWQLGHFLTHGFEDVRGFQFQWVFLNDTRQWMCG